MTITSTTSELTLLRALSEAMICLLSKQTAEGEEISTSLKIVGKATSCVSLSLVQLNNPNRKKGNVGLYRERMAHNRDTNAWERMSMPLVALPVDNPAIAQTVNMIFRQGVVRGKIAELTPYLRQQFQTKHAEYYLVYGILLEQLPWGVLVFNHHRPWTTQEEQALLPFTSALSSYLKREQDQQTLQQQRDYFRTILDNLPTAVVTKDREGKFVMVNKTFANILNTHSKNLIGKSEVGLRESAEIFKDIQAENQIIFDI